MRAGSYARKLLKKTGKVEQKILPLWTFPFEMQINEWYKTKQHRVGEMLLEIHAVKFLTCRMQIYCFTCRNHTASFFIRKWRREGDSNYSTFLRFELKKDLNHSIGALIGALPDQLQEIIRSWDTLSPEIQSALYLLVKAGKGGK